MTDQEQMVERLDSTVDRPEEPDVEAHKLAEVDRLDRIDGVDRIDRVDELDERNVEAHRFDKLEGRHEKAG